MHRNRDLGHKMLLVVIIFIILFGGLFAIKCNVHFHVKALEAYECSVIKQYTVDGILSNQSQRNNVLDSVENYISNNQHKLGIISYERNSSSIVVSFLFGFTHVFSPVVTGYY